MVLIRAIAGLGVLSAVLAYHEPTKEVVSTPPYAFGTSFPMTSTQPVPHYTWDGDVWAGTSLSFNPGATFTFTNSYYVPELVHNFEHDWDEDDDYHATIPTPAPVTMPPTPHPGEGASCNKIYGPGCVPGLYCQVNMGYNPHQNGFCQHSDEHGIGTEGYYPGSTGNTDWISVGNSHTTTTSSGTGSCSNSCGGQSVNGACWCDSKCSENGDCCGDYLIACESQYTSTATSNNGDTLGTLTNLNSWKDMFTPAYTSSTSNIFGPAYQSGGTTTMTTTTTQGTYTTGSSPFPGAPPITTSNTNTNMNTNTYPTATTYPEPTTPSANTYGAVVMPNAYSAVGSCLNNCGQEIKTATGKCWCDQTCSKYGDCCADLKTYCN